MSHINYIIYKYICKDLSNYLHMQEKLGIYGEVTTILYDGDRNVKSIQNSSNLLLDRGINYLFQQIFSRLINFSVVSPKITYKPTFNPFEYMAVGFSDQYYGDPYADPYGFPFDPYIGESDDEFNLNVQAVYAEQHLDTEKIATEVRTINIYDTFTSYNAIIKKYYPFLFACSRYDGSNWELDSSLFYYSGDSYAKYQDFPTKGATDTKFFTIGSEYYLAVTFHRNDAASYSQNSVVYKWNGDIFEHHQDISTIGGYGIEFFTIGDSYYLAVANYTNGSLYSYSLDIYVWDFTTNTFISHQTINGNGITHSTFFTIDSDHYLFVSSHYNGSTYILDNELYKWNTDSSLFGSFQTFSSVNGAGKVGYNQIGNDHYLVIPNYYNDSSYSIDSEVYKWNGTQFTSFQSIATIGGIKAYFFDYSNSSYLAFVNSYNGTNYVLNSPIYKWNGSQFEFLQNISTVGSQDVIFSSQNHLIYPHNYNGQTYDLRNSLYTKGVINFEIADHLNVSGCFNIDTYNIPEESRTVNVVVNGNEHTWRSENIENAEGIHFNNDDSGKLIFELGADVSSDISTDIFSVPFVYTYVSADEDFEIETRVDISNGSGMAGLCIRNEFSADNHNVFIAVRDWLDPYISNSIISGNSETSVYENPTYISELVQTHYYLKIIKVGATVSTYSKKYADDDWTLVGSYYRPDIESYIQVGMFVGSLDTNNFTAGFDYFKFNQNDSLTIDVICDFAYTDFNISSPIIVNTVGFASDMNTVVDEENVFLLHSNSLPITDATDLNGAAVLYGGAGVNVSTKYFGDGALNLPSSGSYIQFPYSSPYEDPTDSFNFDNDDFTVEFFIYLNSDGTDKSVIGNRTADTGDYGWLICIHDVTNIIEWHTTSNVIIDSPSNTALNNSTWYHVAFVRYKGTLSYYLGGSLVLSATDNNYYRTNTDLLIGRDGASVRGDANGVVIDEIRISRGARWTSNFSIPTQAYNRTQQDNATSHLWGTRVNMSPVVVEQNDTLRIVYRMGVSQ